MEGKEVMTAKEVAEFLNISRTSLQRFIDAKELNPINEPNLVLTRPRAFKFNRADVLKFVETRKALKTEKEN